MLNLSLQTPWRIIKEVGSLLRRNFVSSPALDDALEAIGGGGVHGRVSLQHAGEERDSNTEGPPRNCDGDASKTSEELQHAPVKGAVVYKKLKLHGGSHGFGGAVSSSASSSSSACGGPDMLALEVLFLAVDEQCRDAQAGRELVNSLKKDVGCAVRGSDDKLKRGYICVSVKPGKEGFWARQGFKKYSDAKMEKPLMEQSLDAGVEKPLMEKPGKDVFDGPSFASTFASSSNCKGAFFASAMPKS